MPINNTADFSVTRNDLINLALSSIGVSEPGIDDIALATKVFNMVVRSMDEKGNFLHAIDPTQSTFQTIGNQYNYTTGSGASNINANILKLEYAAIVQGTSQIPLTIRDKMSALRTDLKSVSPGQPIECLLHRATLRANNILVLYPTPDQAYTIVYNFRRALYDFVLPADNPDVPQSWYLALQKALSYELSHHFNKPLTERQLLAVDAEKEADAVKSANIDKPNRSVLKTRYY